MKQQKVSLTLPKSFLEEAEKLARERFEDRSTIIRELLSKGLTDYKKNKALISYSEGKLSLGKAAESAGVTLWQFIDALKEKKIPLRYDLDAIKNELKTISQA